MLPVLNAWRRLFVSIATFQIQWNTKPDAILRDAAAARHAMIMGVRDLISHSRMCLSTPPTMNENDNGPSGLGGKGIKCQIDFCCGLRVVLSEQSLEQSSLPQS